MTTLPPPSWRVERHERVGSTQDLARQRLETGDGADGSVLVAREQTGGRGRRGRDWHSPLGGLWLTATLDERRFDRLPPGAWPAAVTVGIAERLSALAADVMLKWPNDLMVSGGPGAKLAGVLLERHGRAVLVGVGANVTNDPPAGGAALATLLGAVTVEQALQATLAGIGDATAIAAAALPVRWAARDALAGLEVAVIDGDREHRGVAAGITADGRLRLRTGAGVVLVGRGHVTGWGPEAAGARP